MSGSLWPYWLQAAKLLCLWDSRGKNTRVGHDFLLQGIFQTQGWNWVSCLSIIQNYLQSTRQEQTWEVQAHPVSWRETKLTGGRVSGGGEGSTLCVWKKKKEQECWQAQDWGQVGLWSDHCDIFKGELEQLSVLFSSVSQSCPTLQPHGLQHARPPWSTTNSWSLLKLKPIESVMPSNHLILCLSPSPPTFSLSQHQGLFKWVSSSHQVAKVLEFQLQHQSFQWIFRTDFL